MRIIKHGNHFEIGVKNCKCGCEFAYSRKDVKPTTWGEEGPFGFESYDGFAVYCPECKRQIDITMEVQQFDK